MGTSLCNLVIHNIFIYFVFILEFNLSSRVLLDWVAHLASPVLNQPARCELTLWLV